MRAHKPRRKQAPWNVHPEISSTATDSTDKGGIPNPCLFFDDQCKPPAHNRITYPLISDAVVCQVAYPDETL